MKVTFRELSDELAARLVKEYATPPRIAAQAAQDIVRAALRLYRGIVEVRADEEVTVEAWELAIELLRRMIA